MGVLAVLRPALAGGVLFSLSCYLSYWQANLTVTLIPTPTTIGDHHFSKTSLHRNHSVHVVVVLEGSREAMDDHNLLIGKCFAN